MTYRLCPSCGLLFKVRYVKVSTKFRRHIKCPRCGRVITEQPKHRSFLYKPPKRNYLKRFLDEYTEGF